MFSVHPIIFLAFIYFAFPLIILVVIYDISVNFLFPLSKYLLAKLIRLVTFIIILIREKKLIGTLIKAKVKVNRVKS